MRFDSTISHAFTTNIVLVILFGILIVSFMISITALIYSKITDNNSIWFAPIFVGLQFVVIASDINLCVEVLFRNEFMQDLSITICGVLCILVILISYFTNIYFGDNIITTIPKENANAISFFRQRNTIFFIIIMICGDCHSAIFALSSAVFGLEKCNSGLLNYELKKMNHIKIIATICLQNIPLIFIQCVYIVIIGMITPNTAFAFIITILSIIFCTPFILNDIDILNDIGHSVFKYNIEIKVINDENTTKLLLNKGKTNKMNKMICDIFECKETNMEISRKVTVNMSSITLYMMQLRNNANNDMGIQHIIQLYNTKHKLLNSGFKEHFELNEECIITFKSIDGPYDITIDGNEIAIDQSKLKQLMDEKEMNYNVMNDKQIDNNIPSQKQDDSLNIGIEKSLPQSPQFNDISLSMKTMENMDESETEYEGMYGMDGRNEKAMNYIEKHTCLAILLTNNQGIENRDDDMDSVQNKTVTTLDNNNAINVDKNSCENSETDDSDSDLESDV